MPSFRSAALAGLGAVSALAVSHRSLGAEPADLPPWIEAGDVPLPSWLKSVIVKPPPEPTSPQNGPAIFRSPADATARRGTAAFGATLPVFGAKRGADCKARWLLVGPASWICEDHVDASADPIAIYKAPSLRYFFVGTDGAQGFENPETADDSAPISEYERGFAVAITDEKSAAGRRWGRSNQGRWIDLRALGVARGSGFHGEMISDGALHFGWMTANEGTGKNRKVRREIVQVLATDAKKGIEISSDPERWVKNVAVPTLSDPPAEASEGEKWIDVDRKSQTLVAYVGKTPVFATLVSTGAGPEGSDTSTPKGTSRIWVKLTSSTMDNLEDDDLEKHFSLEDVPHVQFFNKAVALHGAFWHDDFGKRRSHGCVNLAPTDAAWLFQFTGPHLPNGWSAVLPTPLESGTLVRVR